MRPDLRDAIQALRAGQHYKRWYGKTYREFWAWFNAEDDRIVAMAANDAEADEVREALLDIRADTGRDVPDERADEVIARPPGLMGGELAGRIEALRAQIPEILAADEKDQMDAFAGIADEILEDARDEDREQVWSQLQCILRDAGLIPGDEEPCAE